MSLIIDLEERNRMKLKEVYSDIERYLEEDCYCPNEVYSVDGIFFQIVYADTECSVLGEYNKDGFNIFFVATENSDKIPILMNIWCKDDRVISMERYDMTENNIKNMKRYWEDGSEFVLEETEDIEELRRLLNGFICICTD